MNITSVARITASREQFCKSMERFLDGVVLAEECGETLHRVCTLLIEQQWETES